MVLQPRNRTLGSLMLRLLVPRALLLVGLAVAVLLGHAMAVAVASNRPRSHPPSALVMPTWTAADAAAHPECTPAVDWPRGTPAPYLMVHDFQADAERKMAFSRVWRRTHNATEVDDVWVVGVCGGRP